MSSDSGAREDRLDGTFLQLWAHHREWSSEEWAGLFECFQAIDLRTIVVQWTRWEDQRYDQRRETVSVRTVLELAEAADLAVWVGLAADSTWWGGLPEEEVSAILARTRRRSLASVRELLPMVLRSPSFGGWYLPEEIDDDRWWPASRRRLLSRHLRRTTTAIRHLAPGTSVAVSGFTNGAHTPDSLRGYWSELLSDAGVDRLYFQDGVGAGKVDLDRLDGYLTAVRDATSATGVELSVVVEAFVRTDSAGDPRTFAAVPAPWERLREQIEIATRHSSGPVVAFSVPDYMVPAAGPRAAQLYDRYRHHLEEDGPDADSLALRACVGAGPGPGDRSEP